MMMSPGVFLYFFKKYNILNIEIVTFLWAHLNSFLINSCFSSSSINANQKFLVVSHRLHMYVIFFLINSFWYLRLLFQIIFQPVDVYQSVVYKKGWNIVLQPSKHEETCFPYGFIFVIIAYFIRAILSETCCQK